MSLTSLRPGGAAPGATAGAGEDDGLPSIDGGTPVRTAAWPAWPVANDDDIAAVASVLRGGAWGSTDGTVVRDFERAFADLHGAAFGVAVNSGTTALYLALMASGVGLGDEVIVPPYTFVATATAALLVGAVPVFADIDADTYNIDPAAVERALSPRTRAILPVHFAGAVADMDRLRALADARGLILIEDAAHAHAARYAGRSPGSLGAKAACFSFQSSKNLSGGEGGILLTDDEKLARTCWSLMNTGRTPEGVWYEHHLPGGNFRLTEMQGALLLSQMRRLPEQTRRRHDNGRYLDEKLAAFPGIRPLADDPRQELHPRHLYLFRYDAATVGAPRERFLEALRAEGVPASPGYPVGLHRQPLYSGEGLKESLPGRPPSHLATPGCSAAHCPVTDRACAAEAVWLTHPLLLAERHDMDDIVRAVGRACRAAAGRGR